MTRSNAMREPEREVQEQRCDDQGGETPINYRLIVEFWIKTANSDHLFSTPGGR
jgi:hypothetical protein